MSCLLAQYAAFHRLGNSQCGNRHARRRGRCNGHLLRYSVGSRVGYALETYFSKRIDSPSSAARTLKTAPRRRDGSDPQRFADHINKRTGSRFDDLPGDAQQELMQNDFEAPARTVSD
jgi:hypothetical protein